MARSLCRTRPAGTSGRMRCSASTWARPSSCGAPAPRVRIPATASPSSDIDSAACTMLTRRSNSATVIRSWAKHSASTSIASSLAPESVVVGLPGSFSGAFGTPGRGPRCRRRYGSFPPPPHSIRIATTVPPHVLQKRASSSWPGARHAEQTMSFLWLADGSPVRRAVCAAYASSTLTIPWAPQSSRTPSA